MFNFLLILLVINSCPSEGFRANTRLNGRHSFGTVLLLWASFIELSRILRIILFRCASLLDLHLHHHILIVLTSEVLPSLIILFLILIVCLLFSSYSRFRKLLGNI